MARSVDLLQSDIRYTLIRMTLPMMLGIVSLMLFNLADLYFVGQLGTDALAAMGFAFPVCFTITSLAIGLGIGTSATLARLIGAGRSDEASSLATDNLMLVAVMVLLLTLFCRLFIEPVFTLLGADEKQLILITDYMEVWLIGAIFMVINMVSNASLRSTGDTRTPALLMAGSALLNFILDPLFIFGIGFFPELGIRGAAVAGLVAWSLTTVLIFYILSQRKKLLIRQPFIATRAWQHFSSVMKIGLPASLSNMMTPIAQMVLTYMVAQHGAEAVAAYGVGNRIESLALLVCLALSMTLPPFISQNYGAGKTERVDQGYHLVIKFALCWQILVYLLLILLAYPVAEIFSDSENVQQTIVLWIFIVPLGFAFQAITFLSASSFNALHQPMRAMRISIFRLFLFSIPLAWIGSQLAGLQGMFISIVIANLLAAVTGYTLVKCYIRIL